MSALKSYQRTELAMLARRAWMRCKALARGQGNDLPAEFDAWRHAEVAKACGKLGLRLCSQDDFCLVKGHFLELCGEHGAAMKAHVLAQDEPRRRGLWLVRLACQRRGFDVGYAEAICRVQFKCELGAATARQLRFLLFTINSRRKHDPNHGQERRSEAGARGAAARNCAGVRAGSKNVDAGDAGSVAGVGAAPDHASGFAAWE
jgi:hypothetical protein